MSYVLTPEDLRCPTSGKRAYPNAERALREVEAAWTRPQHSEHVGPMPCRAYKCEDCGWWHLTARWEREA